MATYFSENYQLVEAGAVTTQTAGYRPMVSVAHARMRHKKASFVLTPATGDVLRLFTVRSSDRVLRMNVANFDLGTAVPLDIGLRLADGTVVDADCFCDSTVLDLGTARTVLTDVLGSANMADCVAGHIDADEADFGQPLWKALGLTADPGLVYEVVALVGTVNTGNAGGVVFLMEYNAGD
jgi:hypothetical protein